MKWHASIEMGGTKCIGTIGSMDKKFSEPLIIPTTSPSEVFPQIIKYFKNRIPQNNINTMGIASFGPIDLKKSSGTYGHITSTPKVGWEYFNVVAAIQDVFPDLDIAFDTDVNSAALAEGEWGAAVGLDNYIYITVGTGIGFGIIVHGQPVHGILHPEAGHMILPLHPSDPTKGHCRYHKNCLEGLASGTAIEKRWNKSAKDIEDGNIAWGLESHYLALGIVNIICALAPQRIVIGGGISKKTSLFPLIRSKVKKYLNGYLNIPEINDNIDEYIVPAKLEHSGLLGGIIMASKLG